MDAKLQRRIQRYGWDKAADLYEQHWQQQLAPAQTRLLEMARLRHPQTPVAQPLPAAPLPWPIRASTLVHAKQLMLST